MRLRQFWSVERQFLSRFERQGHIGAHQGAQSISGQTGLTEPLRAIVGALAGELAAYRLRDGR